jgi:hypothetical protein
LKIFIQAVARGIWRFTFEKRKQVDKMLKGPSSMPKRVVTMQPQPLFSIAVDMWIATPH